MSVVQSVLLIIFSILFCMALYVFFRIMIIVLKSKTKRKQRLKRKIKHIFYEILYAEIFKPFDFIKWVIYDLLHGKEYFKLFGIWCFTGYFGQGKTLGAVTLAKHYQKKYPTKNIKIYSNFNIVGQDGKINCWEDMMNLPKSSILIFDEIQSTFTSQKFKDFPIELLWKLTQCRKQELMVFASSPVFERMSIQLRENTDMVVTCKNFLKMDRYFRYSFYRAPEFEKHQDSTLALMRAREFVLSFVASNKYYKNYNTHQIVDRFDIVPEKNSKSKVTSIDRNSIMKEVKDLIKISLKK